MEYFYFSCVLKHVIILNYIPLLVISLDCEHVKNDGGRKCVRGR